MMEFSLVKYIIIVSRPMTVAREFILHLLSDMVSILALTLLMKKYFLLCNIDSINTLKEGRNIGSGV